MNRTRVIAVALVVAAACAAAIASSPSASAPDTGQSRFFRYVMGASIRVEVYGDRPAERQQAADDAFAAIARVDAVMSDYRNDSELTLVNRQAAARALTLSPALFEALDTGDRVARQSGGAFDLTAAPLATAWGVKTHMPRVPTVDELSSLRPLVDFRNLRLDRRGHTASFARPGTTIDLAGVAKGYAAQIAAGSLQRRGLSGLVDAGAVQYLVGHPTGKRAWSIGIGHPDKAGALIGAIDLADGAVATVSGAFRDGSRVLSVSGRGGLVLDPRTLRPATASLSATVVATDGALAQALSNAVFALGPARGLELLDRFPGTWGVVAYRAGDGQVAVLVTPSRKSSFHPAAG